MYAYVFTDARALSLSLSLFLSRARERALSPSLSWTDAGKQACFRASKCVKGGGRHTSTKVLNRVVASRMSIGACCSHCFRRTMMSSNFMSRPLKSNEKPSPAVASILKSPI